MLRAFETARTQGRPSVECYRAGVAAWRLAHPEQSPEYAAKQAVAVILAAHLTLRVDDDPAPCLTAPPPSAASADGRSPDLTPRKRAERAARDERLAQALRENLRRRKEQARAQAERAARPEA